MRSLRTVEEVFLQDPEKPIFVIVACPEWDHFSLYRCPAPIRAWIEQHYPDVVIEPLSGNSFRHVLPVNDKRFEDFLGFDYSRPYFRLGFTKEQAAHFRQAWSSAPLHDPDAPSNFVFLSTEGFDADQAPDEFVYHVIACPGKPTIYDVGERQV